MMDVTSKRVVGHRIEPLAQGPRRVVLLGAPFVPPPPPAAPPGPGNSAVTTSAKLSRVEKNLWNVRDMVMIV